MSNLGTDGRAALDRAADYLERVGELAVLAILFHGHDILVLKDQNSAWS